ncbi:hypothetical protein TH25_23385 [Thalassospira profundimaris]|uniref:Uncharacterized protein n=1 Tax=Thalassospira profundimaris TaxID=502049 RepID=A0A367WKF6_9PROT|nr:hypothetical protein TH25_23385 [Thalassospira profundimaris]
MKFAFKTIFGKFVLNSSVIRNLRIALLTRVSEFVTFTRSENRDWDIRAPVSQPAQTKTPITGITKKHPRKTDPNRKKTTGMI